MEAIYMKSNADLVYRDFDASPALNNIIHKKLEKLNRYSESILHTRVVVDIPHQHKHKGKHFRASIELDCNGMPIIVSHDDASVHIALRDAFSAAERKLKAKQDKKRAVRH